MLRTLRCVTHRSGNAIVNRGTWSCRSHLPRLLSTTVIQHQQSPQDGARINTFKSFLTFPNATHEIKNLDDPSLEGSDVILHGYLGARNDLSKNLYFVPLINREISHSVQIISSAKPKDGRQNPAHESLKDHGPNTPVVISGRLKARKPAPSQRFGGIVGVQSLEVELQDAHLLNEMPKDILVTPEAVHPPDQRHLQIRQNKAIRDALAFRSNAAQVARRILGADLEFIEIETPLLFRSTPEGAREFIVPTRRKGLAYALPQSPQQFKQVLIGSGISRYFQIARCFRDEDLRADRQPEFTQLDLEMSFASSEDVIQVVTSLVRALWSELLGIQLPSEFPRMTYAQAMAKYGVDKPDVRFDMELSRVDHLLPVDLVGKISSLALPAVDAMVFRTHSPIPPTEMRQFVSEFLDSPEAGIFHENPDGGPGIFIYDSSKPLSGLQPLGFEAAEGFGRIFELEDGDLVVLQARKDVPFSGGSTMIGNLRTALYKEAVKQELLDPPESFAPLWVTEFPLFSPVSESEPGQGGMAGLASTHHPFTSPKTPEDVDLLLSSPLEVIGDHYDLVINGVELGGGSRRIHNAEMQRFIMERVLQMSPERMSEFSPLLEVLRAGCPPHAGIALGFDRLVATMLGKASVRDVIAFPKSGNGEDALMKSPGAISPTQLDTYHLQLKS